MNDFFAGKISGKLNTGVTDEREGISSLEKEMLDKAEETMAENTIWSANKPDSVCNMEKANNAGMDSIIDQSQLVNNTKLFTTAPADCMEKSSEEYSCAAADGFNNTDTSIVKNLNLAGDSLPGISKVSGSQNEKFVPQATDINVNTKNTTKVGNSLESVRDLQNSTFAKLPEVSQFSHKTEGGSSIPKMSRSTSEGFGYKIVDILNRGDFSEKTKFPVRDGGLTSEQGDTMLPSGMAQRSKTRAQNVKVLHPESSYPGPGSTGVRAAESGAGINCEVLETSSRENLRSQKKTHYPTPIENLRETLLTILIS